MEKPKFRFVILGCGSSGGVPRLGNDWGQCDPKNPKNRRLRCSMLVQRINTHGTTSVLIDSGPDMRQQLLRIGIKTLDAVLYTHYHADHVNGIDDLRMVAINIRKRLPVWADECTSDKLKSSFSYIFETPQGSNYPPILELNTIKGKIDINGAGGTISFLPLQVNHGELNALGFKINSLAYIPDVYEINYETWPLLKNLKVLIIDALRRAPHQSHTHLGKTLSWIEKLKPEVAYLTDMHSDLDYDTILNETPQDVEPAYDGLELEFLD